MGRQSERRAAGDCRYRSRGGTKIRNPERSMKTPNATQPVVTVIKPQRASPTELGTPPVDQFPTFLHSSRGIDGQRHEKSRPANGEAGGNGDCQQECQTRSVPSALGIHD